MQLFKQMHAKKREKGTHCITKQTTFRIDEKLSIFIGMISLLSSTPVFLEHVSHPPPGQSAVPFWRVINGFTLLSTTCVAGSNGRRPAVGLIDRFSSARARDCRLIADKQQGVVHTSFGALTIFRDDH